MRISAANARLDGWMHGCLSLFPAWASFGSVERITSHWTWREGGCSCLAANVGQSEVSSPSFTAQCMWCRGMAADEADGATLLTSTGLQPPVFAAGVARPDASSSSIGPT